MDTALLLLLFNRPETTYKLFQKLKIFKPKKVYINIDGPREKNLNDKKLCNEVEKITNDINWDCKVFKKINEKTKDVEFQYLKQLIGFFNMKIEELYWKMIVFLHLSFLGFVNKC